MLEKLSLEGKVAIITGAGRGLGKEMAYQFADAGADVVAVARTASTIEQTAQEVLKRGRRALALPTDVTVPEQVERMAKTTISELGCVDILVNSAGAGERIAPIWEINDEHLMAELSIDLLANFYTSRAVTKHMFERKSGKILMIGSSAYWSRGGRHAYLHCAAEGGVFGLARALAYTFAPYNIQVNCIGPGLFPTYPARTPAPGVGAGTLITMGPVRLAVADYVPMKHRGLVEEFAPLAVYLASDAANYITGQYFCVDGGVIAGGYAPVDFAPNIPLEDS